MYDKKYVLVIVPQPKKEEFPNKLARINQCSFLIQIYKPFLSETKQFWITKILHNCESALCVYDQNYALVIVTQSKRGEFPNKLARIIQCSFLIQIYKTNFL